MSLKSWLAERAMGFLQDAPSLRAAYAGRTEGWEVDTYRRRPTAALVSTDNEYNYGYRERMMAEARALCQTFGLPFSILNKYANYCVGGCEVDFQTGDEKWDALAEENWRQRMRTIDLCGVHDFPSLAKLALVSMLRDGDVGFAKVVPNGFPQLQPIESDRIRNSNRLFDYDNDPGKIGGITIDRTGRARSYTVWERMFHYGFDNAREVPAESFILLKDPDRFDGVRGITHFGRGALNHMRDLKEIINAEKKAVKLNTKISLFFKRWIGARPMAGVNLFGQKNDGTGNVYTEEIGDGTILYGLPGEELLAHQANRPSPTFQGFLEFIIRDTAISLDLPLGFVWNMLGTGPAIRLESKQAERTFNGKISVLERLLYDPVCAWITTFDMEHGRLPFNPRWYRYTFQRPSHPSIDVGRETQADMQEHARGTISAGEISAGRGKNIFKVQESKAREGANAKLLAERYDVPVEWIMSFPCATNRIAELQEEEEDSGEKEMPQKSHANGESNGKARRKFKVQRAENGSMTGVEEQGAGLKYVIQRDARGFMTGLVEQRPKKTKPARRPPPLVEADETEIE